MSTRVKHEYEFKGAYKQTGSGKYACKIKMHPLPSPAHIGTFKTQEEAGRIYDACRIYMGLEPVNFKEGPHVELNKNQKDVLDGFKQYWPKKKIGEEKGTVSIQEALEVVKVGEFTLQVSSTPQDSPPKNLSPTPQEAQQAAKILENKIPNKEAYTWVFPDGRKKFRAVVWFKNERVTLGLFDDEVYAAQVVDGACLALGMEPPNNMQHQLLPKEVEKILKDKFPECFPFLNPNPLPVPKWESPKKQRIHYVGVYPSGTRFTARIAVCDNTICNVGVYDTPLEAAMAYNYGCIQFDRPINLRNRNVPSLECPITKKFVENAVKAFKEKEEKKDGDWEPEKKKDEKEKYVGVKHHLPRDKWEARIHYKNKTRSFGSYPTELVAAQVVNSACKYLGISPKNPGLPEIECPPEVLEKLREFPRASSPEVIEITQSPKRQRVEPQENILEHTLVDTLKAHQPEMLKEAAAKAFNNLKDKLMENLVKKFEKDMMEQFKF